jgi:hypothetical protein
LALSAGDLTASFAALEKRDLFSMSSEFRRLLWRLNAMVLNVLLIAS